MTCISYLKYGLRVGCIVGPVNYSVTVVTRDGQLSVRHSGEVPDGEHVISCHDDGTSRSLGVARFTPEGKAVARSSSEHSREH